MKKNKYLIVGGGMTADAAVRGIRSLDKNGTIGILSSEAHPPYKRPPLSKKLWMGLPIDKIWLNTRELNVDLHLNTTAVSINVRDHCITDVNGEEYYYDKLLIATGVSPRRLPYGSDRIMYYRYLDDYNTLRKTLQPASQVTVIGGGFIGSEIAAALRINEYVITMIFPENYICARIFPIEVGNYLNHYYEEKGIRVISQANVLNVAQGTNRQISYQDQTGNTNTLNADQIIAGIGSVPNGDLAEKCGIQVTNGIDVDEYLQTNIVDIYAAGDAANYHDPFLLKQRRVEHEDNAYTMGFHAGRNMSGAGEKYRHLPYFYSDLFEIGYEAVGELDSRLEVLEIWEDKFKKGILAYSNAGILTGLLLWGVFGKIEEARSLIVEQIPANPDEIKKLLNT